MSISTILAALDTALSSIAGIVTVEPTIPEAPAQIAGTPAILLELQTFEIVPLMDAIWWDWPIDLYYFHAERAATTTTNLAAELAAVYPMARTISDKLAENATLGGLTYGPMKATGEPGVITWADKNYIGLRMHYLFREKQTVSFVG